MRVANGCVVGGDCYTTQERLWILTLVMPGQLVEYLQM